jgi:hypothetical protein
LNSFSEEFDGTDAPTRDAPESLFKECAMLVCKWWFPNKEEPHSVVDAIFLTTAEPTEYGVRVSTKLQFNARSDMVVGDEGFWFKRHLPLDLVGQDVTDALKSIETGDNAFFIYLHKNVEARTKVASRLPILYAVFEGPELAAATAAVDCQIVRPPPKRI